MDQTSIIESETPEPDIRNQHPSSTESLTSRNHPTDNEKQEIHRVSARSEPNLHVAGHSMKTQPTAKIVQLTPRHQSLLEHSRPLEKPPGWKASFVNTVKFSWLNVLLIFIPIAWVVHFAKLNDTVVFSMSFVAIIPLAALIGFATEELAVRVGDTFGGLLNATFGNAVELIICILALVRGELSIVQSSMIGSILSNCLLVLGMCYFAGGIRFHEQGYQVRAAQLNINLLSISVSAIVIPVAFHAVLDMDSRMSEVLLKSTILSLSHGISILLLIVYIGYLLFQMWTHSYLYIPQRGGEEKLTKATRVTVLEVIPGPQPPATRVFRLPALLQSTTRSSKLSASTIESEESGVSATPEQDDDWEKHEPKLSVWSGLLLLFVVTGLTGLTAEFLVDSIDGIAAEGTVSKEFIALILLPLVGNAAEHLTAVTVATKNKLDLSMAVAVGSSIQISLFVIPFLVIIGWIIGQPLTLYFDLFETVVLFVSIMAVNASIADGRTNWMEGFVLMMLYVLIAVTAWYYPGSSNLVVGTH